MTTAKAAVIVLAGFLVVLTPLAYLALTFCAACKGISVTLDERILLVSLGSVGVIVAFAFKTKH